MLRALAWSTPKLSVIVSLEVPTAADPEVWWLAQCVERDIATQARTLADLKDALQEAVSLSVEDGDLAQIAPAPDATRAAFDAATVRLEWLNWPTELPTLDVRIGA